MRLWWGPEEDDGVEFASVAQLMERVRGLDQANRERPIMVDVFADDGSVVSIGVGADLSVLTHMNADQEPPYLTSRSNEPLSGATAWFDYGGSETEFRADALIEKSVAFALVQSFLEHDDISSVQWEEE